ncbi:hypothetical protein [Oerskovia paurometabola]|uniref:hypothetical protein n=1 Tax=Oerskovia paurometabola TaxID=162170 RepID=UPI003823481B
MTPPPAGTPWWGWLLAVGLVVGVPALSAVAVALVQRPVRRAMATQAAALEEQQRTLSRAAEVAETIRHQVQNDHSNNLRDDVDDLTGAIETVGAQMVKIAREQRRTKVKLDKMHGAIVDTRDRLDDHLSSTAS